ncbi:RNA polymerase sigma factor [Kribbella sp. NPDC006257]|uniref:RNA polymerase sigma factor n=1 Tax=Kribbella sp. NPDC006257 TaxID=3156738 RepID=UPI0033AC164A
MTPDIALATLALPGRPIAPRSTPTPSAGDRVRDRDHIREVSDASAEEDGLTLEASVREPDRFTAIFDRYFPQVHSYVARRLGTDLADDLSSETFLIAFRQRDRFDRGSGVVRAWLYGIATNLIRRHRRDELRAWRATAKLPLPLPAPGHEERVAAQVTAEATSRRLAAALAKVSAKDREVLMLVALGELTYDEVAAALGIKYGTVCSRLSRARRVVRESLGTIDPTGGPDHD